MSLLSCLVKIIRLPALIVFGLLGFSDSLTSALLTLPNVSVWQQLFYGLVAGIVFSFIGPKYYSNVNDFVLAIREFILNTTKKLQPITQVQSNVNLSSPALTNQKCDMVPTVACSPNQPNNLFKGHTCSVCNDYFCVPVSEDKNFVCEYKCKVCGTQYKFDCFGKQT